MIQMHMEHVLRDPGQYSYKISHLMGWPVWDKTLDPVFYVFYAHKSVLDGDL